MREAPARIEVYMKAGAAGIRTSGAIVHVERREDVHTHVVTRLTGGCVVALDADATYVYQFNVCGEGRFVLAVRNDGTETDLASQAFDAGDARHGPHAERSFSFRLQG